MKNRTWSARWLLFLLRMTLVLMVGGVVSFVTAIPLCALGNHFGGWVWHATSIVWGGLGFVTAVAVWRETV